MSLRRPRNIYLGLELMLLRWKNLLPKETRG
uniref:Uncharacterized protein n=1 Tax=Arundo donax TaxID=35708 RepID=A0A0A9G6Q2_ARUDO